MGVKSQDAYFVIFTKKHKIFSYKHNNICMDIGTSIKGFIVFHIFSNTLLTILLARDGKRVIIPLMYTCIVSEIENKEKRNILD